MSTPFPLRVDASANIPLVAQLSRQLSLLIAGGTLKAGDQLPAARSIAEDLGINQHTVRAAYGQLATDGLISLRRGRRGVVLAYDRTRVPSSAGDVPTFSIGVIIPDFVPFYAPLLDAIEGAVAESRALTFICNAREDRNTALDYLDRLVARRVDGIIVTAALLEPNTALPPQGRPAIVFVDSPGAPGPGVEFDLERSQFLATNHLIEHGHTRIGYLTPPVELPNVAPKLAGYRRAHEAAGLSLRDDLLAVAPTFEMASGRPATERLLAHPVRPSAISAANDALAIGAHSAITSRGLRIPEDVALIGNDDSEMAAIVRPALTSVALPVGEAGRRAVAMLNQITLGGFPDPATVVLDVDLVTRESCGCMPTET